MTAESIQLAYEKFIEAEEKRGVQGQRQSVYASSWSACTRQMALDMLRPDVKPPFQADTLANFRRGRDRERDLIADLTRVGRHCDPPFEVIGGQERFELRDKKGRAAIVGKVDARLKFAGQKGSAPLEIKSFHPNLIQGVRGFGDMFGNRWLRKGAHQLLAYLLASNEPVGFLLLDRPGIPRPLEVRLYDYLDRIEDFLQRAEVAMDAKEKLTKSNAVWSETLPPFINDPSECRVCPFFGVACQPELSFAGASIITEEEILAKIEQHDALDEPRSQYKGLHDELADYLKARTPKTATKENKQQTIAGKYLITSHWTKNTTYPIPDSVKAEYRKVDPVGKFDFSIEKVSD